MFDTFLFRLPIHRCRVTTLSLCHVIHRLLNGLGGLGMRRLLDDVTLGCWCWHHSGLGLLLLDGNWVRGISNTLVRHWNKYCAIQLRILESCIKRWQCSVQQCVQATPIPVHPVYTFVFNVESWWVILYRCLVVSKKPQTFTITNINITVVRCNAWVTISLSNIIHYISLIIHHLVLFCHVRRWKCIWNIIFLQHGHFLRLPIEQISITQPLGKRSTISLQATAHATHVLLYK